jgi:hypothetical protein
MYRNSLWAEGFAVAPECFAEAAGDGGLAVRAMAFRGQVVAADVVPVADDECGVTAWAEGGAAFTVVHVAGEDVVQAGVEGDAAGLDQGSGGVGGRSPIFQSGWKAVKCSGTSGPSSRATQVASWLISSALSFWPGMSRVVISSQQSVSWWM